MKKIAVWIFMFFVLLSMNVLFGVEITAITVLIAMIILVFIFALYSKYKINKEHKKFEEKWN